MLPPLVDASAAPSCGRGRFPVASGLSGNADLGRVGGPWEADS